MPRPPTARKPPAPPDAYRSTLEGLFARRRFGVRPGLEVVSALCDGLGNPERAFPAVHLTGSKGKGSTAALTEAVLRAHGLRTGLFTSPHLASYRDRIQVDREPIPREEVVAGVERIDTISRRLQETGTIDREPTFFEVATVLGFDWFARSHVDVGVIEVGIGGRLDSTNVVDGRVGVITTVELEHTEILGSTIEAIAHEKAGILKRGMTGVLGELPPGPRAAVEADASRAGVPLWHLGREVGVENRALSEDGQDFDVRLPGARVDRVRLPMFGAFQATNAGLAVAAAARFFSANGGALSAEAVRRGLATAEWPGRLDRVARRPDLFYDVAHTPESARSVAISLAEIAPLSDPSENAIVFGCLQGKQVGRILDALSPLAQTLVVVPVRSDRAIPVAELRAAAAGRFRRVVVAPTPADGVRLARASTGPDGFTLVVGSDYLVGELLRPTGADDEPDLSDPGVTSPPAGISSPAPTPRGAGRRRVAS
ncbi:MAG TPA: folylpolyglutamate synthase/dihydrofolate synthase family protein [Thermoplasmata archaeon]|nr:folylpolyglutamate synthase/dihydrofolate synthase family protein [Thermoplasmata archaeon]